MPNLQTNQNIRLTARGPDPGTAVRPWGAAASAAAAALLAGCGNIPTAQVSYYLATSSVSVQVIRSVLCDAGKNPVVATTVIPTVTHQADVGKGGTQQLDLNWFRAPFSDADVKVELFEDGRLKSVNASSTGQGEAVLKAAVSLVTGKAAPEVAAASVLPADVCEKIKAQNGGDPILVVYSGALDLNRDGSQAPIKPEAASRYYADLVAPLIGTVCAVVEKSPTPPAGQVQQVGDEFKDRKLMVRQPGWAVFSIRAQPPRGNCQQEEPPLFSGRALVAQFGGEAYGIPVPKPATFGKQSIGLVFAESGALTSLQYASDSGTTQALGGLNSLLTAARGDTTAQKAAEVQARADLIAEQQRLVQCIATPENCTKP